MNGLGHQLAEREPESSCLAVGLDKRFHDANAGNHFLNQGGHGGGLILDLRGEGFQTFAEYSGYQDKNRQQDDNQQTQFPIHVEQKRKAADQGHDVFRGINGCVGHEALNHTNVVHQPGKNLSGSSPSEKAEGQRMHVTKQMRPKISDDLLRQPGGEVALSHGHDALHHGDPQKHQDGPGHERHVSLNRHDVP